VGKRRKTIDAAMTADQWESIRGIFEQVLDLDPDQRSKFLQQACTHDEDLKRQVEQLLECDANMPDNFMEPSPACRDLMEFTLKSVMKSHRSQQEHTWPSPDQG